MWPIIGYGFCIQFLTGNVFRFKPKSMYSLDSIDELMLLIIYFYSGRNIVGKQRPFFNFLPSQSEEYAEKWEGL